MARRGKSHTSAACRRGFKVKDKVRIRGGWFSGKPWKSGVRGTIVGWSGCGVAEVRANVSGYKRGSVFDIGISDLKKGR
jgi:hypothetical protein